MHKPTCEYTEQRWNVSDIPIVVSQSEPWRRRAVEAAQEEQRWRHGRREVGAGQQWDLLFFRFKGATVTTSLIITGRNSMQFIRYARGYLTPLSPFSSSRPFSHFRFYFTCRTHAKAITIKYFTIWIFISICPINLQVEIGKDTMHRLDWT